MPRVELGSKWKEAPLIVRLLRVLPSSDAALITCTVCGAAWYPHEGFPDDCKWCATALDDMRRWQAELVCNPPDIDPNDIRYDGALQGWAERLAVAVEAELITRTKAETAWARVATSTGSTTAMNDCSMSA